jgi:hypothetical protein
MLSNTRAATCQEPISDLSTDDRNAELTADRGRTVGKGRARTRRHENQPAKKLWIALSITERRKSRNRLGTSGWSRSWPDRKLLWIVLSKTLCGQVGLQGRGDGNGRGRIARPARGAGTESQNVIIDSAIHQLLRARGRKFVVNRLPSLAGGESPADDVEYPRCSASRAKL